MSVEEAAELARRAIYHATFRDGASGGVVSGMLPLSSACNPILYLKICRSVLVLSMCFLLLCLSGFQFIMWDLMGGRSSLATMLELHYAYYPVEPTVEHEMAEASSS